MNLPDISTAKVLLPSDLKRLCEISRVILNSTDWKHALDEVTQMVRSLMIFDNLVVYLKQGNDVLDVIHARAMGRGKSGEADIAWGEEIANQIILEKQIMLKDPTAGAEAQRLERPYILGMPLVMGDTSYGAFLLIRFGGPSFEPEHVQLAQFIAQQITFLIDRQHYVQFEKTLEDQDRQIQLQKDFISTISHELRSPLGFIKGYTTTLLRDDTSWDKETQREFLEIIDQETDHLQLLIDNLLDSSRIQAGLLKMKYQQVRMDSLVKDILTRERMHHPDLITEINNLNPVNPIQGDPQRLGQVIENLVSNALKYASTSKIWITISQDETETQIDVRDQGNGIPEKYLPHIFERFFRNPDQSPTIHGSGLGLFICKQIIDAHDGKISAQSQPGEGTTIRIQLPNRAHTILM